MLKAKIAVFVSGGGTNLQALIDAAEKGAIPNGEIALVLSNKENAFALERAKKHNIPAVYVSTKEGKAFFEEKTLNILKEYGIDLIILAGFLVVLSDDFVSQYPNRILNVHPSLIPAFCGDGFYGLKVHEAALARGVKVTGATVHFVNAVTDGGPIVLQKPVMVQNGDTPEILQKRVMEEAEWLLLPKAAALVCDEIVKEKTKND